MRRSLFGYRRGDVVAAIAEREAALEASRAEAHRGALRNQELDRVSAWLAERVVEREREVRELRMDLARERERSDESLRTMAALADELQALRRQARSQATRIRLRALREAAELTERIGEHEGGGGELREGLVHSLQEAIQRVGADLQGEADPTAPIAAENGHAPRRRGDLFEGLVEVEVGPFSDFSQLVGFEDAAGGIGAMSEISVTRFTQGRATLAMRFKQPVALLHELEQRAPFEFSVRDRRSDRVVLDLGR